MPDLLDWLVQNKSGTKCYIVVPMHGLELNLMKTLRKYSFGDRMTDADREEVAGYLLEIGLHLDMTSQRASVALNTSGSLLRNAMSLSWAVAYNDFLTIFLHLRRFVWCRLSSC